MKLNFDEIMKQVEEQCKPKPTISIAASAKNIEHRAIEMAKQGYEPTAASLKAIEAYVQGYGLWLHGKVGTGKSAFFKCLKPLDLYGQFPPRIEIWSMIDTFGASMEEIDARLDDAVMNELVLDDVGSEPLFNHYGGKMEILPYIIEKRMKSTRRTHITTNLTAKEIAERYGVRIIDRFSEMFVPIEFKGASKRKAKPNEEIVGNHARFMRELKLKELREQQNQQQKQVTE